MSLLINAIRRQRETDGDREVVRKEQLQPQAGSIKKNRKSMANCRQCDRSKSNRYSLAHGAREEVQEEREGAG